MVVTETLQVILNAKDQLSSKIREVNNALKQTGTAASSASTTATSATSRLSNAYSQLQSKVQSVFNNIKNTIRNSTTGKIVSESSLAQPFLNAAETIKQRFTSMTEVVKGKLRGMQGGNVKVNVDTSNINNAETKFARLKKQIQQINSTRASPRFELTEMKSADGQLRLIIKDLDNIRHRQSIQFNIKGSGQSLNPILTQMDKIIERSNKANNTTIAPKISAAGLATLNGQVTTTTGKITRVSQAINKVGSVSGTLGLKLSTAFASASAKIDSFKSKLSSIGSKMQSLVGGLSGVQGAIMGAFGAVGVTSLTQFTIGAAAARQKLNAVTTSITGSEAATKSLNKAISAATNGGIVGFTKVAQAVQQIGIKYNLTNKQLEATAPVLNKIGTLARAMGKDSETAATIMSKAYDGLNGNFMLLQRNLGITKQQLIDAGWSGAANDVDGYTMALNKVLDTKPEMQEYLNSYEGQMERLRMAIQGVGRQIGEIFLPILNMLLGTFLDLHQKCPWLTTVIVALAVGIVGLISVLSVLAPIIMMIVELQEMQAFATIAAYWPYMLLAAAILIVIGVLLYLYNTNEGVRNTMNKIGDTIRNVLVKAWDELQKIVQPLATTFEHLKQVLGRLATQLLAAFGITGDAAENFDWLSATIQFLGKVLEVIVTQFVTVVEVIASIVVPIFSFLVNVIANLINFFVSLGEALTLLSQGDVMGFLVTLSDALTAFFMSTVTNLGQMLIEIWNNLNLIFGGVLNSVWIWIVQLVTAMILGGWQMVVGFLSWIASLPGQFWNYLVQCWNDLTTWAGQVVAKASEAGSKMVTDFINWVSSLPGKLWNWLVETAGKIPAFKDKAVAKMKETAKKMVDDFIDWIKKLPSKVGEWLGKILSEINSRSGGLVGAIMRLGWNMLNSFKNALLGGDSAWLGNVSSAVYDGLSASSGLAMRAGQAVGSAFGSGVRDGAALGGLDSIGVTGNSRILANVEHEIHDKQQDNTVQLLEDIKAALGSLRVEHTGNISLNQNVDVTGDTTLSDTELREAVMLALQDRNILKQITQSREFQSMDKRMKNRMIQEMSRHI